MKQTLLTALVTGLLIISSNLVLASPDRAIEPVIFISVERTENLLGAANDPIAEQAIAVDRGHEPIYMISHQHAANMLGDDGDALTSFEALNSMPATAAGSTPVSSTTPARLRSQEKVIYINSNNAEHLLGDNL